MFPLKSHLISQRISGRAFLIGVSGGVHRDFDRDTALRILCYDLS